MGHALAHPRPRRRRPLRRRPRRAYSAPNPDRIYCPALEQFDDPEAFWSTVLHEHIHWTGHAAYLAHWLDILNEDPKALFRTAAAAQRAVDHLHQLATEGTEADEVAQ